MSSPLRTGSGMALVLACMWSNLSFAQTPADEQLMAWQLKINNSRIVRLLALAPEVMPDCTIAASASDLSGFFVYWRDLIQDERSWREKTGLPDENPPPEHLRPGMRLIPTVPLAEMATVSKKTPGAEELARTEIETWHVYSCVVRRFHAARYFAHYGSHGTAWPDGVSATYGLDPTGTRDMMLPDMEILEPLDALGRFFRAAQANGELSFFNIAEEKYFFSRYESANFVNLGPSEKADAWFRTPPWLGRN